jgi:hypothetical protein
VFNVDRKQKLLGAFNCSLSGTRTPRCHAARARMRSFHVHSCYATDNMLSPGRLYIFEECLGFYSSLPPSSLKARATHPR